MVRIVGHVRHGEYDECDGSDDVRPLCEVYARVLESERSVRKSQMYINHA